MNKTVAFIRSNDWDNSALTKHGTHNGYVAVPPTNKYHGMSYFDIKDIAVHGGITYSEAAMNEYGRNEILEGAEYITDNTTIGNDWWIFGFDTWHYGDDAYIWDKHAVTEETISLMEQLSK